MASTEEKESTEEKPAVVETPAEEPKEENMMTKVPAALSSTTMQCSTTKDTARRARCFGGSPPWDASLIPARAACASGLGYLCRFAPGWAGLVTTSPVRWDKSWAGRFSIYLVSNTLAYC